MVIAWCLFMRMWWVFVKLVSIVDPYNSHLMRHIVSQHCTLSISENSAHYLASWCLHLEHVRAWRTGMFPLHALLFSLMIILVYPGLIVCYCAPYKQIPFQLYKFQIFTQCFTSIIIHFLDIRSGGGDPSHTDFCHQQCSFKIVLTKQVFMPTVSAVSCTLTWRFWNTVFSRARQFSLQTASDRHST